MSIKEIAKYATLLVGLFGVAGVHAAGNEPKPDHDPRTASLQKIKQSALEYLIEQNRTRQVNRGSTTRFKSVEEAVLHLRSKQ